MAMAMDQDKDDIVRRVIRLLASQPNNVIGFADLHANFKSLIEKRQFESLLRNYADQFELFKDGQLFVRLDIKVKVCEMHCSNQICPGNISVCKGLHICKRYILYGNCTHNPCIVGHDLTTSHNMEVLSQLLLDQLPMPLVEDLLKRPIQICEFYNRAGGCRNDEAGKPCPFLHLCKNNIIQGCKRKNCQRSHFIHMSTVRNVLEKHGISMGRIPKENLAEFRKIMQANDGNFSRRDGPIPEPMVERVRQATSDMVSETAANNILNKKICIYHLKSRCAYFERCFNYHCELLYQWFYRFDDSANWETVEPQENMRMELHYSDPAYVEYKLFIGAMLVQLKFKTMKGEGGGKQLTFHRVSTETSAILDSHPLATSWQWFWMAENGDWNKYGDDADGYRSTISGQDLEQAYISNPDGQLKFSTQGHEYILDFAKMVQCNLKFKTEREVSRRPKFVSKDELERRKKQPKIQKPAGSATSGFVPVAPPHWNLRPTDELLNHCELVPLDKRNPRMNTEYNRIEKMFFETMPNTVAIVSIDRVENGDLWHNYVSKKDKLKKRNKGVDVEERQLFFGTSNDTVEAIYRQGFDFRLNGTASGARYGKGSYFATTAKYSHPYTDRQKETMGMFVSKVLVGDYTKGDKSYIRPPHKDPLDLSSPLYDSCVDSVTDPKIFVIFELGQVYPEYLIKYKSDELLNHCKLVPFEEENATLKKVLEVENIGIMRKRLEAQNKQLTGENSRLEDDNSKMKELHQRQEETIKKLTDENLRTKQLEKYCFLYYWLHSDCHVSLETPARTYISIHPPDTKGFHSHQPNVVQSLDEDIKRLGNPTEIMPLVGLNVNEIDEWYKTIDVHFEQWTDDYRMLETALVKGSDDFKNYLAKHKPSIPNKMCPLYIYSAAWEHTLTNCDSSRWHND
ncbi:protein mono-ADP-ribosyltransferase PARP12-like isoform X2 [Mya arenaria]|nr:protein mono-ADP-ribosyltransferase PARP12-like isoform X2 [Mya arenaria]XP_052760077.1 protein mono-ADP-ribosyltransferase PARP12-like isoform X2 [Mya arenaria]XP_052760078.1 protein mono-ADP-ribosyltransferase PARP12-like isoform X2 [Mya arenaria]